MRPDSLQSWQRLRTELNHDWLLNSYLPNLEKWLNVLDGRVRDADFEERVMMGELASWAERTGEIRDLVESLPDAASPARLWERPPLTKSPAAIRAWLPNLVGALWLNRNGVPDLQAAAQRALEEADQARVTLAVGHPDGESEQDVSSPSRRDRVADFRDAVFRLTRSLSALPQVTEVI